MYNCCILLYSQRRWPECDAVWQCYSFSDQDPKRLHHADWYTGDDGKSIANRFAACNIERYDVAALDSDPERFSDPDTLCKPDAYVEPDTQQIIFSNWQ